MSSSCAKLYMKSNSCENCLLTFTLVPDTPFPNQVETYIFSLLLLCYPGFFDDTYENVEGTEQTNAIEDQTEDPKPLVCYQIERDQLRQLLIDWLKGKVEAAGWFSRGRSMVLSNRMIAPSSHLGHLGLEITPVANQVDAIESGTSNTK